MANKDELIRTIHAHVAAVGSVDADALALLYAVDGELQDPAGTTVAIGRDAIRQYFTTVLNEPREMELLFVAVTDHRAAFHFRATPAGGLSRDVIDIMTFNEEAAITSMHAYAGPPTS